MFFFYLSKSDIFKLADNFVDKAASSPSIPNIPTSNSACSSSLNPYSRWARFCSSFPIYQLSYVLKLQCLPPKSKIRRCGTLSREESIHKNRRQRHRIYREIMEDSDPDFESPIIQVSYAKIIEVWVEETEYQGFFEGRKRRMGMLMKIWSWCLKEGGRRFGS